VVMAGIYSVFMLFGALLVRVPADGWKPAGWEPKEHVKPLVTSANVAVDTAWRTPQFWLLWVVLCMNVSAGIGLLGRAKNILQDMFAVAPAVGAGFVGLISIFNMGGRFVWSSVSDYTGRKRVYCIYFILGAALYAALPWTQATGNTFAFLCCTAVIVSMYGGGFATIPAYLKDVFGTYQVGAIHGRLITSWSVASVIGQLLINGLYDMRVANGVPPARAYNDTFYLMCGLLMIGLIANLLVKPVDPRHHVKEQA
jgi:MFS family permease